MKILLRLSLIILFGLLVLVVWDSANLRAAPTVNYSTSTPTPTQVRSLPTPIPKGQAITNQDLRVSMDQAEITTGYDTDYGFRRDPTLGGKFLWVNIRLENLSAKEQNLPGLAHFSAVYSQSEFKPAYGHRQGYLDYTTLKPALYPGQKVDAWLRFDIPAAAELKDLRFVFLPDSLQVNFTVPGTGYSWADHPQFSWQCEQ